VFDPTIYENIKVVIQGAIYDLDLKGSIVVTNRSDKIDLAHMSRVFKLRFKDSQQQSYAHGELILRANMRDLATEILEIYQNPKPGCRLEISFEQSDLTEDEEIICLHNELVHIWGSRPKIQHEIVGVWQPGSTAKGESVASFDHHSANFTRRHRITLDFNRTIDENQIEDIPELLQLMLESLKLMDNKTMNRRV